MILSSTSFNCHQAIIKHCHQDHCHQHNGHQQHCHQNNSSTGQFRLNLIKVLLFSFGRREGNQNRKVQIRNRDLPIGYRCRMISPNRGSSI